MSTRLPAGIVIGNPAASQRSLDPVIVHTAAVLAISLLTVLGLVVSNVTKVPTRNVKVIVVPEFVCG